MWWCFSPTEIWHVTRFKGLYLRLDVAECPRDTLVPAFACYSCCIPSPTPLSVCARVKKKKPSFSFHWENGKRKLCPEVVPMWGNFTKLWHLETPSINMKKPLLAKMPPHQPLSGFCFLTKPFFKKNLCIISLCMFHVCCTIPCVGAVTIETVVCFSVVSRHRFLKGNKFKMTKPHWRSLFAKLDTALFKWNPTCTFVAFRFLVH